MPEWVKNEMSLYWQDYLRYIRTGCVALPYGALAGYVGYLYPQHKVIALVGAIAMSVGTLFLLRNHRFFKRI